jgi:Zn-dependent M28 family amino/carboxypeptidase
MFDEHEAFRFLQAQCDFGPRYPGSPAHRRLIDYLAKTMASYAPAVYRHEFGVTFRGSQLECTNVIGYFPGRTSAKTILLGTHFDTRIQADRETTVEKQNQPIMGANDGGSGTAILLELARIFSEEPPPTNVSLVLFDAEDLGNIDGLEFSLGAAAYCQAYVPKKPDAVIILDMVGRPGMKLNLDGNSLAFSRAAKRLTETLFRTGVELGFSEFIDPLFQYIYCDHIPFLDKGIPASILIDITDPNWHTLSDLPENCDPHSLKVVGEVLLKVLMEERI